MVYIDERAICAGKVSKLNVSSVVLMAFSWTHLQERPAKSTAAPVRRNQIIKLTRSVTNIAGLGRRP